MIYGIEQSTDLREPNTIIKKFRSEKKAKEWAANSDNFTHSDPEVARNWHHTFRTLYWMPYEWKPPSKKNLSRAVTLETTPTYPCCTKDILARRIQREGEEIPISSS